MTDYPGEIARLEAMIEDIRRVRTRTCEPKSNANPRYLALSSAVHHLTRAVEDLRRDV